MDEPNEYPKLTIERFTYQCDQCKAKFDWNVNAVWYGNQQQLDDHEPIQTFCCEGCAQAYAKNQKSSNQS